ncbi:YtxH domain-containing protein [Cytophagales bacterium LB-30]|uniref:YtxH domain-containing protein n=1 Tax=Shiella aurantiaca TaxID=3058365 RepID=A0ABT8F7N5_9BACT|nr:YtxH domain-containing protein [Shiella aurantiaca]MDN4166492.1 YtxH domain-containing protein [Shiella aurantiaca]
MNSTVKTLLGVTIGAAAGFVAGMLLAPDSGKKTRQRIVDKAKGMKDEANQVVHRAKNIKDGVIDETERYGKRLSEVLTN